MLTDALDDDHSAPEAGWPMPTPEVRRLLEPVPIWGPAPSDDEPDAD
jgi:hypothetical protein